MKIGLSEEHYKEFIESDMTLTEYLRYLKVQELFEKELYGS
jgi:hypothetical protein